MMPSAVHSNLAPDIGARDRVRPESTAVLRADGTRLRDASGRHRVLHGINLIAKGTQRPGGSFAERGFRGDWTAADIVDLAGRGFTVV